MMCILVLGHYEWHPMEENIFINFLIKNENNIIYHDPMDSIQTQNI